MDLVSKSVLIKNKILYLDNYMCYLFIIKFGNTIYKFVVIHFFNIFILLIFNFEHLSEHPYIYTFIDFHRLITSN